MERRHLIGLMMFLCLCIGAFGVSAALDQADIVAGTNLRVSMLNQDPNPVGPGQYVELRFRVANLGYDDLKNVSVDLIVDAPFSFDDPSDAHINIGSLSSRQIDEYGALLKWKVRVAPDAIEGRHNVSVYVHLTDSLSYVKTGYEVDVRTQNPVLAVSSVTTTPEKAQAGEEVQMDVTLENKADTYLRDVMVKLDTRGSSFAPVGSPLEHTMKLFPLGAKQKITFRLAVDSSAASMIHQLPLEVFYTDPEGTAYARNLTVGVPVYNAPRYLLNLEESEVQQIHKKGKIVISFSNIGVDDLNFVRVKLLPSDDFELLSAPLNYMGDLESDDFQTAEYTIYTKSDAQSIKLPVEVSFTDEYNVQRTEEHELDLRLYTPEEAKLFGFAPAQSASAFLISMIFGSLILLFWVAMIVDVVQSKHTFGKKVLWTLVVLLGNVVGALIYYLGGRKKV